MPETQAVQIQCPNCRTVYQAPVRSVIDVGKNPQFRQAFLAGQLNIAVCPKCRLGGPLELPLVYHDPAAEFLAIYFPQHLNIPEVEKQRMIGELTQNLMRDLPAEQRKGYFLNPRQFFSRQSLNDAILGTMGVSQEELDRQRNKLKMIDQLRVMADYPKGLELMIKGKDAQFDYEFFLLLSNRLAQAEAAGDEKAAGQLGALRERLMAVTTFGKKAAKQQEAIASLKEVKSAEEFLDKVAALDPDTANAVAVAARPLLDYTFFQKLTDRIEASRGPERERLTQLRDRLLETTRRLDEATRAAVQDSTALLQELLASRDARAAVREHIAEIDDTFLAVLSANMREAERRGSRSALERMTAIYEEIMSLIEESQPPEIRLINRLLDAPYPEGTRAMLKENQAELTPDTLELMSQLAEEFEQRDSSEGRETAKRLRDIRTQAMLLV